MSLIVWYPFNGNYNNYGCSNSYLTVTTTPTYTDYGKIGKALATGGFKWTANQTSSIFNNDALTIAFWIYPTGTTGSTSERAMIFGNDSGSTMRHFSLFQYPTCNDLHWSWYTVSGGTWTLATAAVRSGVLPSNTWTHVVMAYKKSTLNVYINGTLDYTCSCTMNSDTFAYETQVIWNSSYHYINDFRIYDNCLSPKEVREISKALVLHYPLNQPERSSNYFTYGNSEYTGTYLSSDSNYFITIANIATVGPSETWTLSYDAKVSSSGLKLSNYFQRFINGVKVRSSKNSQGFSETADDGYTLFTLTTEYKHYWVTWKMDSGTEASKNLYFVANFTANSGGTVTVKNIKLEKCSVPTNYCPSTSDTINWTNYKEYDTSGFGYNGTVDSNYVPTIVGGSPRYNYCYNFDGTQYLYCKDNSWAINGIDGQTVSLWGYMTDWSTYNAPMFSSTEGGGFNCESSSTGSIRFQVCMFKASDMSASSYSSSVADTTYSLSSLSSGWHHFTFVYSTSSLKIYIDGSEVKSTTYTSYGINHTYNNSNKYLFLCTEANGTNPSSTKLICKLSDFRIYNTALSASDIKKLYNTPIEFTNTGTTITQGEFIEE